MPVKILATALAGVILLLGIARAGAAEPSVTRMEMMPSKALGRDLPYGIYLPPDYNPNGPPLPVVYLLHGTRSRGMEWVSEGGARETADALIAQRKIGPVILVMPDALNSWYVNSADVGGPGDYETALGSELIAWIDGHYRTRGAEGRAIAGISMGGYGALRLAALRPERYAAAGSLSAALWIDLVDEPDGRTAERLRQTPEVPKRIFTGSFGDPFDAHRFVARNPLKLLAHFKTVPKPPAIILFAGDHEDFGGYKAYHETTRAFDDMIAANLPAHLRVIDGGHDWATWSAALPDLLMFFDAAFAPITASRQ